MHDNFMIDGVDPQCVISVQDLINKKISGAQVKKHWVTIYTVERSNSKKTGRAASRVKTILFIALPQGERLEKNQILRRKHSHAHASPAPTEAVFFQGGAHIDAFRDTKKGEYPFFVMRALFIYICVRAAAAVVQFIFITLFDLFEVPPPFLLYNICFPARTDIAAKFTQQTHTAASHIYRAAQTVKIIKLPARVHAPATNIKCAH